GSIPSVAQLAKTLLQLAREHILAGFRCVGAARLCDEVSATGNRCCGLMDMALAYGAESSGFESQLCLKRDFGASIPKTPPPACCCVRGPLFELNQRCILPLGDRCTRAIC